MYRYGQTEEEYEAGLERMRLSLLGHIEEIALAYPQITSAEVEWWGSGDEGSSQGINFSIDQEGAKSVSVLVEHPAAELIEREVEEFVDTFNPGWENNEGGQGKAFINFEERTVLIEHYYTVEEDQAADIVGISRNGIEITKPSNTASLSAEGYKLICEGVYDEDSRARAEGGLLAGRTGHEQNEEIIKRLDAFFEVES